MLGERGADPAQSEIPHNLTPPRATTGIRGRAWRYSTRSHSAHALSVARTCCVPAGRRQGGGTVLSRRASGGEDTRGVRADGAVRPCVARGAYFFLDCRAVVLFAVTVIVTYFFRALYSLAVCLQKRAPCALAVSAGGGLPSGPGSRGRGRGPRGGSRCPPRRRGLRGRPWGS